MKGTARRVVASILLLALTVTLCSCGPRATMRPVLQTPIRRHTIKSVQDLDRRAPFYGKVKLRSGPEYEGTILSVGDALRFKHGEPVEPRIVEFDSEEVLRVKMFNGGSVGDYAVWAVLNGLAGAAVAYAAKAASNLKNAYEDEGGVDHEGMRAWARWGFLGVAAISPFGYQGSGFAGDYRVVYDDSAYGETRSRLPSFDWTDWDARRGGGE